MCRRTKGAAPRGRARAAGERTAGEAASDLRVAGGEVKELEGKWGSAKCRNPCRKRAGKLRPAGLTAGYVPPIAHAAGPGILSARGEWSAGLQTGIAPCIAPCRGAKLSHAIPRMSPRTTGMARCRQDRWGWTSPSPYGVPAMGEHGSGSFAAFGRDAGLKTGAPMPCRPTRGATMGVSRPASSDTQFGPDKRHLLVTPDGWVALRHPFARSAIQGLAMGVSRPAAAMPV